MDVTSQDKVINRYIKQVCKSSDPSTEYNAICNGLLVINTGAVHIDSSLFRKVSNKFTLFYKITAQGDIVARND